MAAQPLFAAVNKNFANRAPGKLYLFPYPATDPGGASSPTNLLRIQALLALVFGADLSYRTPTATAWGDIDESGLDFKTKVGSVTFPRNDGTAPSKRSTNIEEATVDFTIYDADPAHWADVFGCQAADLISVPASAGKAGRQFTAMGAPNSSRMYVAILVMQSATAPEFDFAIWPRVNFVVSPEVKYSAKDKLALKVEIVCNGDLYMTAADGSAVYFVPGIASTPAL